MMKRSIAVTTALFVLAFYVFGCGTGTKGPRKYEKNPGNANGENSTEVNNDNGPIFSEETPVPGGGKADKLSNIKLETSAEGAYVPLQLPYTGTLSISEPEDGSADVEAHYLEFEIPQNQTIEFGIDNASTDSPDFGLLLIFGEGRERQVLNTSLVEKLGLPTESDVLTPLIKQLSVNPSQGTVKFKISVYSVNRGQMLTQEHTLSLRETDLALGETVLLFPYPEQGDLRNVSDDFGDFLSQEPRFKYQITGQNLTENHLTRILDPGGGAQITAGTTDRRGNVYIAGDGDISGSESTSGLTPGFVAELNPRNLEIQPFDTLPKVGHAAKSLDIKTARRGVYVSGDRKVESATSGESDTSETAPFVAKYSRTGNKLWDKTISGRAVSGEKLPESGLTRGATAVRNDGGIRVQVLKGSDKGFMVDISPRGQIRTVRSWPTFADVNQMIFLPNGALIYAVESSASNELSIIQAPSSDDQGWQDSITLSYSGEARFTDMLVDSESNSLVVAGTVDGLMSDFKKRPLRNGRLGFVARYSLADGSKKFASHIPYRGYLEVVPDFIPMVNLKLAPGPKKRFYIAGTEAAEPGYASSEISPHQLDGIIGFSKKTTDSLGDVVTISPTLRFGTGGTDTIYDIVRVADYVLGLGATKAGQETSGIVFRSSLSNLTY